MPVTSHGMAVHDDNGNFHGFLCLHCLRFGEYSQDWDACYCPDCDLWLEEQCKCGPETGCPFAGPRPEKPSEAGVRHFPGTW